MMRPEPSFRFQKVASDASWTGSIKKWADDAVLQPVPSFYLVKTR